jgi:uridine monophosphate synthetase
MMEDMAEWKTALALALFEYGAIKFGAFKLKLHELKPDAPLSPICVDLSDLCREWMNNQSIAYAMSEHIRQSEINFSKIADVSLSISPAVAALMVINCTAMVTLRPEAKTHGTGSIVIGPYEPGGNVLLIDDVISEACSKLEAIETLKSVGLIVNDVLVVIDLEQGGKEELAAYGVRLHSMFTLKELCELYLDEHLIDQDMYNECAKYFKWTA